MSEDRAEEEDKKAHGEGAAARPNAESTGSKVDPDFIPDESHENPNQKRAREHPEETGS
jgi:hypothetical protein